jgi:hypothetical protein
MRRGSSSTSEESKQSGCPELQDWQQEGEKGAPLNWNQWGGVGWGSLSAIGAITYELEIVVPAELQSGDVVASSWYRGIRGTSGYLLIMPR